MRAIGARETPQDQSIGRQELKAREDDVGVADLNAVDGAAAVHVEQCHRIPLAGGEPGTEAVAVEAEAAPPGLAAGRADVAGVVETNAQVTRKMRPDSEAGRASVAHARCPNHLDPPVDVIDLQHGTVRAVDGACERLTVVARTRGEVVIVACVGASGMAVALLDLSARHIQLDVADRPVEDDARRILPGSLPSADPFPLPVLDRLGTLLGAHRAGYGEFSFVDGGRSYSTRYFLQNRAEPAWVAEAVARLWHQDPITCRAHARAVEPLAISDRVSRPAFHRLEFFRDVYRPFGTADSVRLFLPAPNAMSRFLFFDQEHWGLKRRERELLGLLRLHLALWRSRWSAPAFPAVCELTAREREILQAVADGVTNREIAAQLWISPHTVRTHLQHIFEKLDVRTRTEAAGVLRNSR